ncbi:hypothetical protein [Salinibacterium sp. NG253]|uniref:hypothetical protein n=1 Tax=Salinibacterium sp. NG253 TaxID=2792039 RepID=UPI0027DDBF53|nr:hypothetical protein [Salinibacterium sp. NG253]
MELGALRSRLAGFGSIIDCGTLQPFLQGHRVNAKIFRDVLDRHSGFIAGDGRTIPAYPRLYLRNDPDAPLIRAAREANAGMPDYTIGLLEGTHDDLSGEPVVVLGETAAAAVVWADHAEYRKLDELAQRSDGRA